MLNLEPATTALVLIDMQNGIFSFALAPHSPTDLIARTVPLVKAFRQKGSPVILVRVAMHEIRRLPVDSPTHDPNAPPPPAMASELIPQLEPQASDVVVTKRQWGAFYGTDLDQQLRRRGVRTIVIGGVATNFGVESTARGAFDRGYELVFVEDAMSSVKAEVHQFAIEVIFPKMGRVRSSEEILQAMRR